MKESLDSKIESFIKKIEGVTPRQAMVFAKNEVNDLLSMYTLTTTRSYLTRYKKEVSKYNSQVIKHLRLSSKDQGKVEKSQNIKLKRRHGKIHKIKDSSKVIDVAIQAIRSENAIEMVCGLCLLTGRRVGEILKTAKFTNSKNSKNVMYFKGQLKTKRKDLKYEIYVLGSMRDECKSALKKVRQLIDTRNMTLVEVDKKYNNTVNNKVKSLFGRYLGGDLSSLESHKLTSHKLRAAYSAICINKFYLKTNSKSKYDKTEEDFLSDLLGHEDDVKTPVSYKIFNVIK